MSIYIQSRCYSLQKLGNHPTENEDAAEIAEPPTGSLDYESACYAVADGATTGAFSAEWAQALVATVVSNWSVTCSLEACAEKLRETWAHRFASLQLPWYAEAKARAGSFATLLSLRIAPPQDGECEGKWEAAAIGDTCLFQVRDDQLHEAFPLTTSTAFGSTPDLLASKRSGDAPSLEVPANGDWQAGDQFYLMTDALAAWFLSSHEQSICPWAEIAAWRSVNATDDHFVEWIAELRADHRLRNDDVTLIVIEISNGKSTTSA